MPVVSSDGHENKPQRTEAKTHLGFFFLDSYLFHQRSTPKQQQMS